MSVIVDIHSHIFPDGVENAAGESGPEIVRDASGAEAIRVGSYRLTFTAGSARMRDPQARIKHMDDHSIDILGVTIMPMCYLYWLDPAVGVPYARSTNDAMAAYCAYSDRLFFIPTLPLQDIDASVKEWERAVSMGGRGVNIASEACGRPLGDRYFWPVYQKAVELDMPIFIHPYPVGQDGDPGNRGPDDPSFNWSSGGLMLWLAGYLHQETLALASLMLNGVFDKFPALKVCISHGGGAIPFHLGRFEYARLRRGLNAAQPLRTYLPNIYFDTVVHEVEARQYLVKFAGPDNVVIGSNSPGWDGVDGVAFVREMGLPPDQEAKILGETAARLFKLT